MAIDTAEKRKTVAGIPFWPLSPSVTPNSSKDDEWRAQAAHGYWGLSVSGTVAPILQVDWDGDDSFGHANSDLTADTLVIECRRGRDYASQLIGRSSAGTLQAMLRNEDGLYSSFNSSSAIFGDILPGRKVRVTIEGQTIWAGFLDTIIPMAAPGPENRALLTASGPLIKLSGPNARVNPPAQSSVQSGDIIDAILDAADWPAGDRSIDAGEVPVSRWFIQDRSALAAIQEMSEDTEFGFFYEGTAWNVVFEGRYHRILTNNASEATFSDASSPDLPYEMIEQADPLREIYNDISAQVQPYSVGSEQVLWTLSDVPFNLSPGASLTYIAQYPNGASGADAAYVDTWTTPVVGTDITQTGVTNGDIGVSVSKTATKMFITITNNHGSSTASITLVQAKGTPVTKGDTYRVSAENTTSQTKYGKRAYPLISPWFSNAAFAQAGCDFALERYEEPRPILTLEYNANKSAALKTQALQRAISDRITVVAENNTQLGINGEFYIEEITHRLSQGKTVHEVMYELSPADDAAAFWILDVSELGTETILAP